MVKLGRGACTLAGILLAAISPAQAEDWTVLHESRPLVARTGAWQTYHEHIDLPAGQEKRPLRLTFINGAEGRKAVADLSIQLGTKTLATIKDFDSTGNFNCLLTGTVHGGRNNLLVKVFGPSGARLVWRLATEPVLVSAVSPQPFSAADTVVISGKNFGEQVSAVKVMLGGKAARVLGAKNEELRVKPPAALSGPEISLTVSADGVPANPVKVRVWAIPHVKSLDFLAGPPGHDLHISGSGFAVPASENVVHFGSVKAEVIGGHDTSLHCRVPEMHFPKWHVPITVTSHGMTSKDKVTFNVDQRVILNEGVPMN